MINKNLLPLTLGGLGIGITEFVMMGLLPDIAKDLAVTIPEAGHLISAYALGVVIGAPLLVIIAGKYPPKKILIALMVLFTVCLLFSMLFLHLHPISIPYLLHVSCRDYHMAPFLVLALS